MTPAVRTAPLTLSERAALDAFRAEWLAVGLSTEPADRSRAEAGVEAVYRAAGREPPDRVRWLESPWAGCRNAGSPILHGGPLHEDQRDLQDQLEAHLRWQLDDHLRDQIWDQLFTPLNEQVWGQVTVPLLAHIRGHLWNRFRDQLQVCYHGQHGAPANAWVLFGARLGVRYNPGLVAALNGIAEVARSAGWWWPYRDMVILTERPCVLHRDDQGRLHSDTGPAVQYPDGWGVWAIHGVRVPRHVVEAPSTLSAREICDQGNGVVRRVMIERFGADRYLREIGADKIHVDEWGTLWRAELTGDEPLVMVQVTNATPEPDGSFRDYWLRVPPDCRTARESVAWSFDVDASAYEPVIET